MKKNGDNTISSLPVNVFPVLLLLKGTINKLQYFISSPDLEMGILGI